MEDTEIIDLYWQRDQRAIDETHGKYGGFLAGIAWNILRSHSDAEECVNDTYLRTWNAIPPARPSAFRAWAGAHRPQPLSGPLEAEPHRQTGRGRHGGVVGGAG